MRLVNWTNGRDPADPARRDHLERQPPAHLGHRPAAHPRRRAAGSRARADARRPAVRRGAVQPTAAGPAHRQLAGLDVSAIDQALAEWNYGEYEGRTTVDIREEHPDWNIWTDGCPGGESPAQVGERLDRCSPGSQSLLDRRQRRAWSATGTACGCSAPAGSGCRRRPAACCGWTPPPSACSATSTARRVIQRWNLPAPPAARERARPGLGTDLRRPILVRRGEHHGGPGGDVRRGSDLLQHPLQVRRARPPAPAAGRSPPPPPSSRSRSPAGGPAAPARRPAGTGRTAGSPRTRSAAGPAPRSRDAGGVPLDDAALLQPADPLVHRGHRQPHLLGKVRVRQPTVAGQRGDDGAVDLLHAVQPTWKSAPVGASGPPGGTLSGPCGHAPRPPRSSAPPPCPPRRGRAGR